MDVSRKKSAIIILLLLFIGASITYWLFKRASRSDTLVIYGNIDIRQVQVAFYVDGRILNLYVQEGDRVHKGQLLAELDPARFRDSVNKNQAQVKAQEAILKNAKITLDRNRVLVKSLAVSKQNLDDATATHQIAQHKLQADRAALAIAQQDLIDSKLYAPQDGAIQDRILEPGDMVTPQNPVFTLALDNPVWVRAYLPEKSLGQIQLGMRAWILSDSFPNQRFSGWVGFISPTAEFTPKNVETTELRTKLMYQVRVYACNPGFSLRLGMPVTVEIPLKNNSSQPLNTQICGS